MTQAFDRIVLEENKDWDYHDWRYYDTLRQKPLQKDHPFRLTLPQYHDINQAKTFNDFIKNIDQTLNQYLPNNHETIATLLEKYHGQSQSYTQQQAEFEEKLRTLEQETQATGEQILRELSKMNSWYSLFWSQSNGACSGPVGLVKRLSEYEVIIQTPTGFHPPLGTNVELHQHGSKQSTKIMTVKKILNQGNYSHLYLEKQ